MAEDKTEIILAQWQTCVEMANSVSQRRDAMNNIFITLNLAIIAAVSITWNIKSLFILVAGIVVCAIWLLFIRNYTDGTKLERTLPIMFIILYGVAVVTIVYMKFC